jgi:hypothetical protein
MRRTAPAAVLACLVILAAPVPALAQGESAEALRPRTIRLSVGMDWNHWTERFGAPSPLNPLFVDGAREPIGVYAGSDSLGTIQLPFFTPTQSQVQSLTGQSGWLLDVGRARLTMDASVRSTPFRLEWAASRRLGFRVSVPIVRARMSVFLTGPDTANSASLGNVGFNPAFLTAGALDAFRAQADTALRALRAQAANGPLALRAQAQNELNALQPLVCGLYSLAGGSSSDPTSLCFAPTAVAASVLLPVAGKPAGDTLAARLATGQTGYAALAAQLAGAGVAMPAFSSGFTLPSAPLDSNGIRRLFYDPRGPIGADSLLDVVKTGFGDMEVGFWLQLADRPRWRSQLAVNARLPTGNMDSPDNLVDLPLGDHQTDVEVAWRNDFVSGSNLWFHVGGRYGTQMADQLTRRVSPWYLPFAPASATAAVKRQLGSYFALDVVPNWQLDDAFGIGIGWHYFHQAATTWTYVDPADEARIGFPASVLGEATAVSRMRVGAGVTFSTVERYAQHRASLPYRVTWSYNTTFYGRGGQVPKAGVMMVEIQAYLGGWGR